MSSNKVCRQEFSETSLISEYKWTIHNFSSVTDKLLKSSKFSHHLSSFNSDMKWQLYLYPYGDRKDCKGCVSIFLESLNDFVVTVDYEVTVSSSVKSYYKIRKSSHTYRKKSGRGWHQFIERSVILPDLAKGDGTLTVAWKMSFFKKPLLTEPQLKLLKDVGSLAEARSELCDVILISNDGTQHRAHKAILVCRSKVFSAMFQHNMKESQYNKVNIEDIDNETLKHMLRFMYTGKVECMRNNAEKLLLAADKYDLDDLREMCINYISENMSNYNIMDIIKFAHAYNICDLKSKTKEYFLQNHKAIMSIKGREFMKNLSRDIIEDLLYDLASDS